MRLAELNKKSKIVLYGIILIALAFVLYKFLLTPQMDYLDKMRKKAISQKNVQKAKQESVKKLGTLGMEIQTLKMQAEQIEGFLFSREEATSFMRMLPRLVDQTGNVLVSITPLDPKNLIPRNKIRPSSKIINEVSCMQVPVKMDIRGKYVEILKLLEELEGLKRLTTVSEIDIAATAEDPSKVDARFVLNLIQTDVDLNIPETYDVAIKPTESVQVAMRDVAGQAKVENKSNPEQIQTPIFLKTEKRSTQNKAKNEEVKKQPEPIKDIVKADIVNQEKVSPPQQRTNQRAYSVQVGAFSIRDNSDELVRILKSNNYDTWLRSSPGTKETPYHVLVGKFKTKSEADQFGKTLRENLSWIEEYMVKEIDD